jgi:CRP/FNR family transcriptional regulator, cyclic AMP receptor protein
MKICREFAPQASWGYRSDMPTHLPELHRAALMSADWFASLPEAVRADVVAHGRMRVLAANERLFSRGAESDGMYGVLEGCIRISGISWEGRETILDFYGPGSWIGEVSALDGLPRIHDANACGLTAVLHIPVEDLADLLAAHPVFCRALLRLEAQRLRIVLTAIEQYSVQPLEHRLANRLLMLARSFGVADSQGLKIDLHLSQETLAMLIGATRQRVNQILRAWENEGILSQDHGRLVVRDRARLEKLAAT